MKLARTGIIAAAVLAVATVAFAQEAGFLRHLGARGRSGGRAAPAGGGGGGRGMGGGPMTVKQTATDAHDRATGRERRKSSRSTSSTAARARSRWARWKPRSTAKWDGAKLVITTKSERGEQTQTWSLAGGVLTIERTGAPRPAARRVYKKTT